MKFTITIQATEALFGLFTYVEDILSGMNVPNIVFSVTNLTKLVNGRYPSATPKQVQQAVIYLNSRKDRSHLTIFRIKKDTYKYINYAYKYKTITI